MEGQTYALYLIALAILQQNDKTFVNREISDVLERLQQELDL
jgi:hypothetical protein